MTQLCDLSCEACRVGAPLASQAEIEAMLPEIPQWEIKTVNNINQLVRTYTFANFVDAIAFTNRVGELAEAEGHHPALLTEWGRVEVSWWSHKIKGLHKNDFVMAAKTDALYTA